MDGTAICDPMGGKIRILGAECVLLPIPTFPVGDTDGPDDPADPCALDSDLPQCKEGKP